jgi:hypothetical protein
MTAEVIKSKSQFLSKQEIRESIIELEDTISQQEGAFFGDTDFCPLKHSFAPGIYVREIFIPAGMILTGKIHKHEHPNFLMSGTVEVITEGGGIELLKGPLAMISPPGTKRGLKAHTDLVWITVHHNPTNTQDLEELEKIVIAQSFEEYDRFVKLQGNRLNRILNKLKKFLL